MDERLQVTNLEEDNLRAYLDARLAQRAILGSLLSENQIELAQWCGEEFEKRTDGFIGLSAPQTKAVERKVTESTSLRYAREKAQELARLWTPQHGAPYDFTEVLVATTGISMAIVNLACKDIDIPR